jgi:hypothetical protein
MAWLDAYNNQVDTNQQWYFRLRAINTHDIAIEGK